MKKIINILLALTLIVVSAFSLVACGNTGDNGDKKGLLLKKYAGEDFYTVYGYVDDGKGVTSLDIGAVAGDKTVGRIAKNAFSGNDTLVEVIVPTSVEEIASGAFQKMKKLEKITLPFVGETALSDSYIYESDEAEGKATDGTRIFAHIFGTEEYSYGESVTVNYGSATASYFIPASLKEVTIKPAGEYKIPMYAFASTVLLEKVNLVGNITAIGSYAFQSCRDLSMVNIPATVTTIEKFAFEGCSYLTNLTFDNGSTLKEIKESAFAGVGISELVLPATVEVIGLRAFKEASLQEVTLSASLTSIKPYAFFGCKYLSSLNVSALGATAKPSLGASAFEDCEKLDFTTSMDNAFGAKGANYKAGTKNA